MKLHKRAVLLNSLKKMANSLSTISKEISTMDVSGLSLVREDLEPRRRTVHGQRQNQPVTNRRITNPAGMGITSDTPNLGPDHPVWNSGAQ